MRCANEKWKEIFVLNDLSFETLNEDIPITIVKNVLKYPEQVREFLDNGYGGEMIMMNHVLDQENLLNLVRILMCILIP